MKTLKFLGEQFFKVGKKCRYCLNGDISGVEIPECWVRIPRRPISEGEGIEDCFYTEHEDIPIITEQPDHWFYKLPDLIVDNKVESSDGLRIQLYVPTSDTEYGVGEEWEMIGMKPIGWNWTMDQDIEIRWTYDKSIWRNFYEGDRG